jgi:hypothetical protein
MDAREKGLRALAQVAHQDRALADDRHHSLDHGRSRLA